MKVRNGFVSNSSSSSFVVYGTCLSEEEIRKCFGWDDDIEEDEEKEFYELLDEKIGEEYTWTSDEDSNEIYVGTREKSHLLRWDMRVSKSDLFKVKHTN
jgi:hypothetical protein